MAFKRFSIDLAIPENYPIFNTAIKDILSAEELQRINTMNVMDLFKKLVTYLQTYSVKINAGNTNEEQTNKATYHICRHDEGLPCDSEISISQFGEEFKPDIEFKDTII